MVGIVYELVLDEMDEEMLKMLEELLGETEKNREQKTRLKRAKKDRKGARR